MLSKEDFDLLKSGQFCDNSECACYNKVNVGNIGTNSRVKNQVYCKVCKNIWVATKGTMFFALKTPIEKIIRVLLLICRGMGVNNTCRQENVRAETIVDWIKRAANHTNEFTEYLQKDMNLDQVQIDEFWSFIRKKKKKLQTKKN